MEEKATDNFVLRHYATHSLITDPGKHGYLFEALPREVPALIGVVQGLIVHLGWSECYDLDLDEHRRQEIYLRTMPEMLSQVLALDSEPLTVARPPERRLVGICRDFAVLLVAMLRHQDVPARLRVGFAGYFPDSGLRFWDHRIAEFWDAQLRRWVMVDPQIDAIQRREIGLEINTLDITVATPFFTAGEVWRQCRQAWANPQEFGDGPNDVGMAPIRYALLHDFDALNKMELVGFDAWHPLIEKPESELTEAEAVWLDAIAEITINPDSRFGELRNLYTSSSYGQAVRSKLVSVMS